MITFKNLVDAFNEIATKHFQIHKFESGELSEIDVEKMDATQFPMMFLQPSTTTIDERTMTYSVEIFILDQTQEDDTGINDSYSDTLLILKDVIAEFRQIKSSASFLGTTTVDNRESDKDEYIIEFPISCEPFTERFANLLTGWNANITIQVHNENNLCIAPYSS